MGIIFISDRFIYKRNEIKQYVVSKWDINGLLWIKLRHKLLYCIFQWYLYVSFSLVKYACMAIYCIIIELNW